MENDIERHPFEPFLPQNARILFLGSFPPQSKRWSMEFYYPNWINDFWRIMGLIWYEDKNHFCLVKEKRFDQDSIMEFCRLKGFAMYDTACAIRRLRDNASDKFLEVVTPTDIPALLSRIPECHYIVTTGQKATDTIVEIFGCDKPEIGKCVSVQVPCLQKSYDFFRLPSTSRAYPLSLEKKAECYKDFFIKVSFY